MQWLAAKTAGLSKPIICWRVLRVLSKEIVKVGGFGKPQNMSNLGNAQHTIAQKIFGFL